MTADILDYTFGPQLQTGQTTDYSVAGRTSKDDGALQRGITKTKIDAQYVVLTTGQYSGTTAITVNGKTDTHSNECVYDKSTTLFWSRTQSATVFGSGVENLLWEDAVNGEDVFGYCDAANTAVLAGFSDWRVPNLYEVLTLMVYEGGGVPNAVAFPVWNTSGDYCSGTNPAVTTSGLSMIWVTGIVNSQAKTTTRRRVCLVRAGIES